MAHRYVDRVMHATLSTGTGDLVLGQAFTGYQSIAAAGIVPGDTMDVCIEDVAAGVWETTRATLETAETISRGEIYGSSAGGARVDFGAGMKRLYLVYPGDVIETDRDAAVVARDEAAALVDGFDSTVAAAKATALDVIEASVAAIIIDSGLATTAAGEAVVSADTALDAADRAAADGAAASASAAQAKAAADETAAAVTNAAIQRETLVGLQAVTGVAEAQLGVVYGTGADRGTYRYLSGVWTYESATLPQVEGRVGVVESMIKKEPGVTDASWLARDRFGSVSFLMSRDGSTLRSAGFRWRRNADGSADLARNDGVGMTVKWTARGVQIGGMEHTAAPPGVWWALANRLKFSPLTIYNDFSAQISGLRINYSVEGKLQLLGPRGELFVNDLDGVGGAVTRKVDHPDLAYGWADKLKFIPVAIKKNGTLVARRIEVEQLVVTGAGGVVGGGTYSAAEIAARNAANLAYSARVALTGNITAQRPTAAFNHFLLHGQSLSTGLESWPSLTRVAPFAGNLMVGQSVNRSTGTDWEGVGDNNFHPLVATVLNGSGVLQTPEQQALLAPGTGYRGETPLEAALTSFRRSSNDRYGVEDDLTRKFVGNCVGFGGQDIASLSKGGAYYDWVLQCATLAKAAATAAGGSYAVPALLWMQGEQDYADGTTKEEYKTLFRQLMNVDIRNDVQIGIAGQGRPFLGLMYQTGGSYTEDGLDLAIGRAQLELALEEPDWYMACPVYPVTDKGGHLDPNGSRWVGEQFGKVLAKLFVHGQGWQPMRMLRATGRDRKVLIDYHVPVPPVNFGLPYVQGTATDWATKGFAVRDGAGANPIVATEIVAETVVQITLARDRVGSRRLRYAGKNEFNGNGCVRDSDPTRSFFNYEYNAGSGQYASANIPALNGRPYSLENWCAADDIDIIED